MTMMRRCNCSSPARCNSLAALEIDRNPSVETTPVLAALGDEKIRVEQQPPHTSKSRSTRTPTPPLIQKGCQTQSNARSQGHFTESPDPKPSSTKQRTTTQDKKIPGEHRKRIETNRKHQPHAQSPTVDQTTKTKSICSRRSEPPSTIRVAPTTKK